MLLIRLYACSCQQVGSSSAQIAKRNKSSMKSVFTPEGSDSIPRPQETFETAVDNSNAPFVHRWCLEGDSGAPSSSNGPSLCSLQQPSPPARLHQSLHSLCLSPASSPQAACSSPLSLPPSRPHAPSPSPSSCQCSFSLSLSPHAPSLIALIPTLILSPHAPSPSLSSSQRSFSLLMLPLPPCPHPNAHSLSSCSLSLPVLIPMLLLSPRVPSPPPLPLHATRVPLVVPGLAPSTMESMP